MYAFGLKEASFKYVCGHMRGSPAEFCQEQQIKLVTARRGLCAFQVLVHGDQDFMLAVTDAPIFYKSGPLDIIRLEVSGRLPGAVNKQLIGLIEDDDRQLKADLLLTQDAIFVAGRNLQPVWVEFEIPESASAGIYEGKVILWRHRMFATEEKLGELSFTIEVKDVTLPLPQDYHFYLDLWQHSSNISRKHETPLWSDAHFNVLDKYVASLAALGQKAATVIVSEIPWSGQGSVRDLVYPSDLFEYSMVRVRKDASGEFRYDYSILDRYVDLCERHGIKDEIEVFGLINIWQFSEGGFAGAVDYIDDIRVRYYDEASGSYAFLREGNEIEAYIKALEEHFANRGWLERVRVVADEPADLELYQRRLENLRRIAPSFKFKAAINHKEMLLSPPPNLSDFVPFLYLLWDNWDDLGELRKLVPGRFLWYVCCGPEWPNTFLRSPLIESRLIPVLTFFMGCNGFLRWNYTVWPEKPRERLSFRAPFWPAGDTNFVYPGNFGGPLLSLRYKLLLKGIQDFELLWMVKQAGMGNKIQEYFSMILRSPLLREARGAEAVERVQETGGASKAEDAQRTESAWNAESARNAGETLQEKRARGTLRREELYSLNDADYERATALLLDALADLGRNPEEISRQ